MKVITVHFGKGGVGKSSCSWMLSSFLSRALRVVIIDLDPQATLSNTLLVQQPKFSAFDVLAGNVPVIDAAVPAAPVYGANLRVLSASQKLAHLEQQSAGDLDRYYLLRDALAQCASSIDIVVIDTPPASGSVLVVAALVAATHLIAPISTDAAAAEQLPAFERFYSQIRKRLNPDLNWIGILPTMYDARRNLDNEVLEELRKIGPVVFPPVPTAVKIREAMATGTPATSKPIAHYFEPAMAAISTEI